ncbi:MAG: hypothetical protein ACTSRI_09100 [Promethearchaeota archaeon]
MISAAVLSIDQFYLGYREKTNVSIFDNKSPIRLDIKVVDKEREKDVLKNAIQVKILGYDLYIAPLEYVLIGKVLYMGKIVNIPDAELFEYQDIVDFVTVYTINKDKINMNFLHNKVEEIGLLSTLERLVSIKF